MTVGTQRASHFLLSAMVRSIVLARPRPDLCSHCLPSSTVADMRVVRLPLGEVAGRLEAEAERAEDVTAEELERMAGGCTELERPLCGCGLTGGDWLNQASASAMVWLMVDVRAGPEVVWSWEVSMESSSKDPFLWSQASPSATVWAMVVERGEPSSGSKTRVLVRAREVAIFKLCKLVRCLWRSSTLPFKPSAQTDLNYTKKLL